MKMSTITTIEWPPVVGKSQLEVLSTLATTFALSHGLVYLPIANPQPQFPTATNHAPLSLFPSPIPRRLFEKAKKLQSFYNVLYARIATDKDFLDSVMGAEDGVGKADEFTRNLWRRWKEIRDRGRTAQNQPLQLGLFRSDYMLHNPGANESPVLKQVEFNTMSSSFGPLSERIAAMHRYLLKSTGYFGVSSHLKPENLPPNTTTAGLAEGLAAAHNAYEAHHAYILFVVQEGERNVFDQRWLEYELLEKHSIYVIRQTFNQLLTSAHVDPSSHVLTITTATSDPVEISTVYFRAGYTPNDYPTPAHYDVRGALESSKAINCPSIPLQLAGGKKVQEILTKDGVLEKFLSDPTHRSKQQHFFTEEDLTAIRETWMEMWALDEGSGDSAVDKARAEHLDLVLKPQREGGGNNVYKEAIPSFLDTLPVEERQAWIAMKLIRTPPQLGNYLIRAGGDGGAVRGEVISELGIFGWALFGGSDGKVVEKEAGWLVRTKTKDSNEGGVAAGFSVLDSIVLVD